VTSVGIWVRPSASASDSVARDRGIAGLNLVRPEPPDRETFGLFISSNTILRGAIEAWNQWNQPDRYDLVDSELVPNPDGAVHLTGFDVSFESPNHIVTRISGFDEDPIPDVDFQITITDSLSAYGGQVHCNSQPNLVTDTSILGTILAAFLTLITVSVPFLPGLILKGLVLRVGSAFVGGSIGGVPGGVGCTVASNLPNQIMIRGGKKITFLYTRVAVNGLGLFCAGIAIPGNRTPAAEIGGPNDVTAILEQGFASAEARFVISLSDVLQPQISWVAEDGVVQSEQDPFVTFAFNIGPTRAGVTVTRGVSAHVIDLDNGAEVSAQRSIRFHVMSGTEPPEPPKPREPANGP
jgi:hypothetical protein